MAYVKQEWVNGTTHLDAEHMNHIEDGIESLDTNKITNPTGGSVGYFLQKTANGEAWVEIVAITNAEIDALFETE